MQQTIKRAAFSILALVGLTVPALGFEIDFDWSDLPACTSGDPASVDSPPFTVIDVPAGTAFIRFTLVDLDVPEFDHGGGVVAWDGSDSIPAGEFAYLQPCPPDGPHLYEWQATAQTEAEGGALGTATAAREYPE